MSTLMTRALSLLLLLAGAPLPVLAQGLPTTQPAFLRIIREEVKLGRGAEHAKLEAGWPAAFERAKSPDYYLAMDSLTGSEAWFVQPAASYSAMGEAMAREQDPALSGELDRLRRADGDLISGLRIDRAARAAGFEPRHLPGYRETALLGDHRVPDAPRRRRHVR